MSLTGAFNQIADDIVDIATPFARRFAGVRRMAVAEGDALALYEAPPGGAPRRLDAAGKRRAGRLQGELRLPAGALLAKTLSFPAATGDYLDPVIENRLDRLTPWAPDRVVYGYRAENADDGGLAVNFVATSRDVVELWTARAEALGFTPTALGSAAEPLAAPLQIDLWRGRRDPFRLRMRRAAAVAAVVLAAVVLPLTAWSFWSLHVAEQRVEAVESRSAAARNALRQTAGLGARDAELIGAKRPEAAIMTLIDRLATSLPDGTVLRDLEIEAARVRLTGVSGAAPELIGLLEASGAITGARFAAPVTRNADGRDGFEILAQRVGAPVEIVRP